MAGLIGRQLGQYTILETLGSGGMATVYRAYQPNIGRDVAIKVIRTELFSNENVIRRFKQEAQIIARLQHPHILRVFDFGIEGDLLYLVMELKKRTLAERLREKGRLSAEEVARYLDQIGAALDHAHSEDVIHRDLKPQNVLLDRDNNAFLSDFGIARLANELTQTTTISGTPAYIAPEQWEGKKVDGRIDIYALAVMTYQLLTGTLPFTGDTPPALMYQHLNDPPPPIRRLRPDLPEKVEAVLRKGMAKRPEDRFQSASAFARAFREALNNGQAHKPSCVQNALVGLSVLAVLVLLAMIALSSLNQLPMIEQPSETPTAPTIQVADVPTDAPIFTATVTLTDTPIATDTATLTPSHTFTPQPILPPELAAQATVFAQATSAVQTAAPTLTQAAQQTADAARIATGTAYQAALEANLTAVAQTLTATPKTEAFTGTLLSATTPVPITLTDVSRVTELQTLVGHTGVVYSVAWSPDGRYLATGSHDNTVRLWEAATGQHMRTLAGHTAYILSVAWSPDGRYLVSGSADKTISVWEVESGQLMQTLAEHLLVVTSVAWSPDGRHIASGSGDGKVRVWDAATGQLMRMLSDHTGYVLSVAWSLDGHYLASGTDDNTIYVRESATGRLVQTLTGHAGYVLSVAWSPDKRHLASAGSDNTIRVWDVATGERTRVLAGHTGWVRSVTWSPDNRYLASASRDGTIRIWDVATWRLLRTLTGHTGAVFSIAWSPDGRYLASASDDRTIRIWGVPAR
jgi:WD40 repeat protein/serine/threonine protein kinase